MSVLVKKYAVNGENIFPFKQQEGAIVDSIPAGLYTIAFHPMMGYYLHEEAKKITLPQKIYGSTLSRVERCFSTYDRTADSLTVGLFGNKGAGKTLLANVLAQQAIDRGIPVIDVSQSFSIDKDYLAFIESLGNIVILFDEFLKRLSTLNIKVDEDEAENGGGSKHERANTAQDNMLTFLQGTNNSKRLTVLIDNESEMLSGYIKDRPGRLRYMWNYEAIEPEVVTAVAKDAGLTDEQTESLVVYTQMTQTTFDVMRVIIQEWNFYPEAQLSDITDVLNVPDMRSYDPETYDVKFIEIPHPEHYETLENIVGVQQGQAIVIKVRKINPFVNHAVLTREQFYQDHNKEISDFFDGWPEYSEYCKSEFIEKLIFLYAENLIGYSPTTQQRMFRKEKDTVIEVTPKEGKKPIVRKGYSVHSDAI